MRKKQSIALLFAVMLFGFSVYGQAISLTIGSGDYYMNVGDYDYLPYAMSYPGGQNYGNLSFNTVMGEYGNWTSMQPFGRVWRPDVAANWRPYTNGHWSYTNQGPTWVGYEPWSWAGDHYGNWVFSQQYGWVWIPGYEYHPGRVSWAQGYNSIGWVPMPPPGYDYSRGYLSYMGPQNQFTYHDDDFSIGFGFGGGNNDYYYGGPYYDPRYRNMYYSPGYLNLVPMLWSFIDNQFFGNDNYADYYVADDYNRYLFDRRLIRISSRPLDRVVIERVTRQPVRIQQVQTRDLQVDGRRIRVTTIQGEEERIRKNSNRTVREVIAPAYAQKGKSFKGENAKSRAGLVRGLKLDQAQRRVETVDSNKLATEVRQKGEQRKQQKAQLRERKKQEIVQVEKQGRIKEKKDRDVKQTGNPSERQRTIEPNRPAEDQDNLRRDNNRPDQEQKDNLKRNNNNRPEEVDQKKNAPVDVDQQRRNNRPVDEDEVERQDQQRKNRPVTEPQDTDKDKVRRNTPKDTDDNQNAVRPDNTRQNERDRETNPQPELRQTPEDDAKKNADTEKQKQQQNKKSKSKDKDKDKDKDDDPDQPNQ